MARVKSSRIKINHTAVMTILNGSKAQAFLKSKAISINNSAKRWFMLFQEGQSTPPILYMRSFKVKQSRRKGIQTWLAYNDDPTALWVEFGAHAGGKTFILKYRPYGKALDEHMIK